MDRINELVLTFLLNAAWLVTLISLSAAGSSWLLRRAPARYQHFVWLAALLLSLVLPLATLRHAGNQALDQAAGVTSRPFQTGVDSNASSIATPILGHLPARQPVSLIWPLGTYLTGAFMVVLFFRGVRLSWAVYRTLSTRRGASPLRAPEQMSAVQLHCQKALGIRQVPILGSPTLAGPVTLGVWRPCILLPNSFFHNQSNAVLTSALGHEMAHICRRDFAVNLVCELALLPLSWHPGAYFIKRRINQTRELACDEMVAQQLLDGPTYARSIVAIAEALVARPRLSFGLGIFDADNLKDRVSRLLETGRIRVRVPRLRLAVAALTTLFVGLGVSFFSLNVSERYGMPELRPLPPPPAPPPPPPRQPDGKRIEGASAPRPPAAVSPGLGASTQKQGQTDHRMSPN